MIDELEMLLEFWLQNLLHQDKIGAQVSNEAPQTISIPNPPLLANVSNSLALFTNSHRKRLNGFPIHWLLIIS